MPFAGVQSKCSGFADSIAAIAVTFDLYLGSPIGRFAICTFRRTDYSFSIRLVLFFTPDEQYQEARALQQGKWLLTAGILMLAAMSTSLRAETISPDDPLPRLLAALQTEPLAFIACRDARTISEKFSATTLAKMIADPTYERGAAEIESRAAKLLGLNMRTVWPLIDRSLSGISP